MLTATLRYTNRAIVYAEYARMPETRLRVRCSWQNSASHLRGATVPAQDGWQAGERGCECVDGIQKAVAADRYAFFTSLFKKVLYHRSAPWGRRVSEQAVPASGN